MASFALKLLCLVAAAGVDAGNDNTACSQDEHDSPACLEDRASLLQTSSILQKREGSVETEQEEVMHAISACGCSCAVSTFAKTMMESSGFTDAKVSALIRESGCSVQKVSCLAETEARRLKRTIPPNWSMNNVKSGDRCSDLLAAALTKVPPQFKLYIKMVKPTCTGTIKLSTAPYQCPKPAETTDSQDMSQKGSVKDTEAQTETVDDDSSKQDSDQNMVEQTAGSDATEQTAGSDANATDTDDMSQQNSVQDTAKHAAEPPAKKVDIGDMYQQAAKSNADGSLTWRQVLKVPQTSDLKQPDMRKLEKAFAQHDHDHDLTLSKEEVPTFVSAFKATFQAPA